MTHRAPLLVATLLLLVLPGCNLDILPRACTLIGCQDGLSVEVEGLDVAYRIELHRPDGTVRAFECPASNQCMGQFFFEGVRDAEVTIRIVAGEDEWEETVRPTYDRHQPNGRGCPPVCHQAFVTVRPDAAP